jgi:nicotinamide-nucleotide amidase
LAYLPNLGRVRLRLTARGEDETVLTDQLDRLFAALEPLIGEIISGFESELPIQAQIGDLLQKRGQSIATAESCTGGRIAALLSSTPGASAYFHGSVVPYKTDRKLDVLGVPKTIIEKHSVVSDEVALSMAKRVREVMKSDYGIAVTGNAGPSKGDSDAAVGTVCIAIVGPDNEEVETFAFGENREKTLQKTVNKALEITRKVLAF